MEPRQPARYCVTMGPLKVRLEPFNNGRFFATLSRSGIPVVHLKADKYAEHDDQRFHGDSEPVLLAKAVVRRRRIMVIPHAPTQVQGRPDGEPRLAEYPKAKAHRVDKHHKRRDFQRQH